MQTIANGTYFVTGIDTDAGKSYATAIIAKKIAESGRKIITQKFIQTGCIDTSDDIETHRRIMGIPMQEVDLDGTTCPEIFTFPSSPQLAAALENREIQLDKITAATAKLQTMYDIVLVEGAGGLLVPLTDDYTTADYIQQHNLPIFLVTSPRLGSINHTALTLEVCRSRDIQVAAVVYNHYPQVNNVIEEDTLNYIRRYVAKHHPDTPIYETEHIA